MHYDDIADSLEEKEHEKMERNAEIEQSIQDMADHIENTLRSFGFNNLVNEMLEVKDDLFHQVAENRSKKNV